MSALDYIRECGTAISCDTQDPAITDKYQPRFINATSNQGIIWTATQGTSRGAIHEAAKSVKSMGLPQNEQIDAVVALTVAHIGKQMMKNIDGCILNQTNPKASFSTQGTVASAKRILASYKMLGVDTDRIIIKLPATWEALQAAPLLKEEGIKTLGTMVLCFEQAVLCSQMGCYAISTYVNASATHMGLDPYPEGGVEKHPGILLSKKIHEYYRAIGTPTQFIPAGMIYKEEAVALAGVDGYTLPEHLLEKLSAWKDFKERTLLSLDKPQTNGFTKPLSYDEATFKWALNQNPKANNDLIFALNNFHEADLKLDALAQTALEQA